MKPTSDRRQLRKRLHAVRRLQPYGWQRSLWLALVSTLIISVVVALGEFDSATGQWSPSFHLILTVLTNLVKFLLLYAFCFALARRNWALGRLAVWGLVGSLLIASGVGCLSYAIEQALYGTSRYDLFSTLILHDITALIAYLMSLLLVNVTHQQQVLIDNERLQAENLRIRYESLARQMSPHFLFNSLNTLDALIGTGDSRAHLYLQNLAETYRYVLGERSEVSLADEMQFTHAYMDMMLIRFGDSLSFEERIDSEFLTRRVPPISVQLLVENAIKHNVVSSRHPMKITLRTTPQATLCVSNPVCPKQSEGEASGRGLVSLSARLCMLCGRDLNITNADGIFSVEIPLI